MILQKIVDKREKNGFSFVGWCGSAIFRTMRKISGESAYVIPLADETGNFVARITIQHISNYEELR